MFDNKENTEESISDKLRMLYQIQLLDSKMDEIKEFRMNIPIELEYLKKELDKLKHIIKKIFGEIDLIKEEINKQNKKIKVSKTLIKKYEKQINKIKNNKELFSIEKEIDYQKLEIQLSNKKITICNKKIQNKKNILEKKNKILKDQKKYFLHKKKELEKTLLENEKEHKILLDKYFFSCKKLDNNLLKIYQKIRSRVKNGIAISPVQRGAPLGSYLAITPQKYSELIQCKKLLIDEHSGRILIDEKIAEEERKKFDVSGHNKNIK
ncbi:zinc ribbon domain-containing protein [Blattabacterium cuenoti]|uniref:zinc ribbon domain-containing protein n=1 Tax=Blattabacterium cuenoti TaxID=1653831 RepID=UPI00163C7E2D|nr:hypothetical protein [Blattabacterium cuenoti]